MFVITSNKREIGLGDAVRSVVAMSLDSRSLRPIEGLFRKGRYGTRLVLEGSYVDHLRYEEKKRKYPVYTIG